MKGNLLGFPNNQASRFLEMCYLEVHGTNFTITVLTTVLKTILGHLRGLEVSSTYS